MKTIWIEALARKAGFKNLIVSKGTGLAGGLALMWNDEVNINFIWKNNRIICCDVEDFAGRGKWRLFGYHGTPYNSEKVDF